MNDKEIWKDIEGYEGMYQISNKGRVRSLERIVLFKNGKSRKVKSKVLSTFIERAGYECIKLYQENKAKPFKVHRLVAIAFIECVGDTNLLEVNHIDGNKLNNNVANLEWCTRQENILHGYRTNLITSDKVRKKVKCVTTGELFNSIEEACKKYGNIRAGIIRCCKGKSLSAGKCKKTNKKLVWEYIDN